MESSVPGGLVGQTLDQRYEVTSLLARGGMATVYLATDLRLDRVVALKVMHPHLANDPGFVARFQREVWPPGWFPSSWVRVVSPRNMLVSGIT